MTDLHPPTPAYRPPVLRIAASYPATDGSCPESIEVEINATGMADVEVAVEAIAVVINALASVPSARHQPISDHPLNSDARFGTTLPTAASRQS